MLSLNIVLLFSAGGGIHGRASITGRDWGFGERSPLSCADDTWDAVLGLCDGGMLRLRDGLLRKVCFVPRQYSSIFGMVTTKDLDLVMERVC